MKNIKIYHSKLINCIKKIKFRDIEFIAKKFQDAKIAKKTIYICGNGGSAANADHISNDLMLGLNKKKQGYKIVSLSSNIAKITCIANDIGYHNIYSHQINEIGSANDILICLSGSGNSPNIVKALKEAKRKNLFTISILGYKGGRALKLSNYSVHFRVEDMQISEDMQMIFFNSVMKYLSNFFEKKFFIR